MSMYKHRKPVFEKLSHEPHPDFEVKETRVSDYLRRYGTGHIDDFPTASAPEVHDDRSVDEMLSSEFEPEMATESVDIVMEIERNQERFEKAIKELELTKAQRKQFDDAVAVLNDKNADFERKREAYAILDDLASSGKVKRSTKY